MGINGNKMIAVECGGSKTAKLQHIRYMVDELYVLPYGETKPFLWVEGVEVCRFCGHTS